MKTLESVSKKSRYNLHDKVTYNTLSLKDYSNERDISDLFYSSDGKSGNVSLHCYGNDDKVVLFILFRDIEDPDDFSRNIITENHIHRTFDLCGRVMMPPPVYKFYIFDVDTAIEEGYASNIILRLLKYELKQGGEYI